MNNLLTYATDAYHGNKEGKLKVRLEAYKVLCIAMALISDSVVLEAVVGENPLSRNT